LLFTLVKGLEHNVLIRRSSGNWADVDALMQEIKEQALKITAPSSAPMTSSHRKAINAINT